MVIRKIKRMFQIGINTLIPYRDSKVIYYSQYSLKYFFKPYGKEWLGITGCGPVSCAIVASSLLKERICPDEVARWSYENGFYEYRHGSMHSLIPEYFQKMRLKCMDLGADVGLLREHLGRGSSFGILLCKAGVFSAGRHFVAVSMEEGYFKVYNSANVLDCYRRFDESEICNALVSEKIYIGPIWCISEE